ASSRRRRARPSTRWPFGGAVGMAGAALGGGALRRHPALFGGADHSGVRPVAGAVRGRRRRDLRDGARYRTDRSSVGDVGGFGKRRRAAPGGDRWIGGRAGAWRGDRRGRPGAVAGAFASWLAS